MTLRCPQCGARQAIDDGAVSIVSVCDHCHTVVVAERNSTRVVGRDLAGSANVDWTKAVCCRLCGGPLPEEIARAPRELETISCQYCGHRAQLDPGVVAVIKLALTRPRLLPPVLRRLFLYWGIAAAVSIAALVIGINWRSGHQVHAKRTVTVQDWAPGTEVLRQELELGGFATYLEVEALPRQNPQPVGLRVYVRHVDTDTCRWGSINLDVEDGAHGYPGEYMVRGPPPGRIELWVSSPHGQTAGGSITFTIESGQAVGMGYVLLLLNALLIGMLLDVASIRSFQQPRGRLGRIARGLIVAALVVFVALIALDRDVGGRDSFDRSCRRLPAEGSRAPGR